MSFYLLQQNPSNFLELEYLEAIKQDMFREIVRSKVLQKHKFKGKYFMPAIDGSGLQSYDYEPYPGCPFKEHKNGKKHGQRMF